MNGRPDEMPIISIRVRGGRRGAASPPPIRRRRGGVTTMSLAVIPAPRGPDDADSLGGDLGAAARARPAGAGPAGQRGAQRIQAERLDQEIVHAGVEAGAAIVVEDVGG